MNYTRTHDTDLKDKIKLAPIEVCGDKNMDLKKPRNQSFIEDRLWYIEWLLTFRGWFSRSDLMGKFGIQEAAASRDIRRYKEKAESNLYLNHAVKRYEANLEQFSPIYTQPAGAIYSKLIDLDESQSLGFEGYGIETIPQLSPAGKEIAGISRAILNKKILKIDYCSMSSGSSIKKIAPHSMFHNDLKTYVRCYDLERSKFLDLVIGRISHSYEENTVTPESFQVNADTEWNTYLSLELVVHPRITHKEAIQRDMQMTQGVKKVSVRKALAQYWLRRWCVDCSKDGLMTDTAYQLHLRNHEEIEGVHGYFPGINNHLD